jgi:hypothetical protein
VKAHRRFGGKHRSRQAGRQEEELACSVLHAGFLLGLLDTGFLFVLLFKLEDEGNVVLRNVG